MSLHLPQAAVLPEPTTTPTAPHSLPCITGREDGFSCGQYYKHTTTVN